MKGDVGGLGAEAVKLLLVERAATDFGQAVVVAAEEFVAEGGLAAGVSVGQGVGAERYWHDFLPEMEKGRLAAALPGFFFCSYFIKLAGN